MSKFNKLYNLILESILTEDIQSKIKKAIQTLIKFGQLKDQNDPRVEQVKTIIKRNSSIDINGKTKLDQLLKANQTLIKREQNKNIDLDSIKEFSQKKEYPNGIVIYKVQQSKKGQQAVRKIVDICWGYDANPWCLISRGGDGLEENYESHWRHYIAYPKHIAFQNGQLLAFCADNKGNCTWWDRNDKQSSKLKLLDGSQMTTDSYEWSEEELTKLFFIKNKLVLNKETGLYDSNGDVEIKDKDLIDGHFPVKFGKVEGSFKCSSCSSLISLQGAPEYVGGSFNCFYCDKLQSLKGAPEFVGGIFDCSECYSLQTLQGAPKEVGDVFECFNCSSLISLKGAPKHVGGDFYCFNCPKLKITKEDRKKYKIK